MKYSIFGKGRKTIVFIAGFLADERYFKHQTSYFQKRYKVIVISLIGEKFATISIIKSIKEVLKQNNINRIYLCGHSMGAGIAMLYSILHPKDVEKLILVGASPSDIKMKPSERFVFAMLRLIPLRFIRTNTIKNKILSLGITENKKIAEKTAQVIKDYPRSSLIAQLRIIRNRKHVLKKLNIKDELKMIRCPTLLIHGAQDKIIPIYNAIRLNRGILDSKLIIVKGAAHNVNFSKPIIVNKAIHKFITN